MHYDLYYYLSVSHVIKKYFQGYFRILVRLKRQKLYYIRGSHMLLFWPFHDCQGCHGQGIISGKLNFFQVREKSGNFMDGQGKLERTWKIRGKSGNSNSYKWLWQAVFRKFIYSGQEGIGCTFS